jgi:hypothetical protein
MAKTTKRGYKEGRPKRDIEEDSDESNDKDYNDMQGDYNDDKEDDEYEEDTENIQTPKRAMNKCVPLVSPRTLLALLR